VVFPEPFRLGAFHGDGQVAHLSDCVVGQFEILHVEPEVTDVTEQPGQCARLVGDLDGDRREFLRRLPVLAAQRHGAVLPEGQEGLEGFGLVEHPDQVLEIGGHLVQFPPDGRGVGRDDLPPQSRVGTGDVHQFSHVAVDEHAQIHDVSLRVLV